MSAIRENGQPQKALSSLFINFRIVEMRYVSYHSQRGHDLTLHNQFSTNSKRGILILISKFQGELKHERTKN